LKEGVESSEIAERFIAEFEKDFASLKLKKHSMNPKVTEAMGPIVDMVKELVDRGVAYVAADGEVLFSVRKFDGYGKLSNKNLDDLEAGARVEVDKKKRDPMDFALWKPAKPGEPKWASPWCDGRPGWHIECSAMVKSLLGDSIDIHGGGSDLIFPHHENEIAQSEGSSGKPFVKYWMHNNMITFAHQKMSKSVGNLKLCRDFVAQYNAEILKYMMLSVHYRSLSDFSDQAIEFAVAGLARFYSALNLADQTVAAAGDLVAAAVPSKAFAPALELAEKAVTSSLNDDFNTPEMFAAMYTVVRAFNASVRLGAKVTPETLKTALLFRSWILDKGEMLSLFQEPAAEYLRLLDDMLLKQKGLERAAVDALVAERTAVRAAKDFKRSDELRDQLLAMGIAVQDGAQGTSWEVAK
jgi:cysteinyl-tRNA synthetase